jgi:hypothetical protein
MQVVGHGTYLLTFVFKRILFFCFFKSLFFNSFIQKIQATSTASRKCSKRQSLFRVVLNRWQFYTQQVQKQKFSKTLILWGSENSRRSRLFVSAGGSTVAFCSMITCYELIDRDTNYRSILISHQSCM